ncbi:hypothetical protein EAG_02139 [Camponotus floridanus]|uniref:Uncharacterized protein n=1 Tax=Camponotus floridanus TaxID=104421 RepID=E2B1R9_CAMFO|nr:hypothetical protein EAG_02139 [Camponotus floridanus]
MFSSRKTNEDVNIDGTMFLISVVTRCNRASLPGARQGPWKNIGTPSPPRSEGAGNRSIYMYAEHTSSECRKREGQFLNRRDLICIRDNAAVRRLEHRDHAGKPPCSFNHGEEDFVGITRCHMLKEMCPVKRIAVRCLEIQPTNFQRCRRHHTNHFFKKMNLRLIYHLRSDVIEMNVPLWHPRVFERVGTSKYQKKNSTETIILNKRNLHILFLLAFTCPFCSIFFPQFWFSKYFARSQGLLSTYIDYSIGFYLPLSISNDFIHNRDLMIPDIDHATERFLTHAKTSSKHCFFDTAANLHGRGKRDFSRYIGRYYNLKPVMPDSSFSVAWRAHYLIPRFISSRRDTDGIVGKIMSTRFSKNRPILLPNRILGFEEWQRLKTKGKSGTVNERIKANDILFRSRFLSFMVSASPSALPTSASLVGPTGGVPVTSSPFRFIASYGRELGEDLPGLYGHTQCLT